MATTDHGADASAIVIPMRVPAAITPLRERWDRAAAAGAGPHVTILYPFMPASSLDTSVRAALAEIVGTVEPFDVRFAKTYRTAELVWLEPEPSEPFAALTSAVVDRFPEWPPYGGAHDDTRPHLTVVESAEAPLVAIETAVIETLPFEGRPTALAVWQRDAAGHWRTRWRIPLGLRP